MEPKQEARSQKPSRPKQRMKYEPPKVTTYQGDEILRQMGPVGGCISAEFDLYAPG